jgi:uncharacterized phage protein gp47/JayE
MGDDGYAAKLAAIITDHIKTAAVTVNPGIAVTASGGGITGGSDAESDEAYLARVLAYL